MLAKRIVWPEGKRAVLCDNGVCIDLQTGRPLEKSLRWPAKSRAADGATCSSARDEQLYSEGAAEGRQRMIEKLDSLLDRLLSGDAEALRMFEVEPSQEVAAGGAVDGYEERLRERTAARVLERLRKRLSEEESPQEQKYLRERIAAIENGAEPEEAEQKSGSEMYHEVLQAGADRRHGGHSVDVVQHAAATQQYGDAAMRTPTTPAVLADYHRFLQAASDKRHKGVF